MIVKCNFQIHRIFFSTVVSDNRTILTSFHILLLEHLILCRLVMGQKGQAIREVATAAQLCASGPPRLLAAHSAQLHTLLGLYAMSMNSMEAAEAQLNIALRVISLESLYFWPNLFVFTPLMAEYDGSRIVDLCQSQLGNCLPADEARR